jgi:hypothetical protein
MAGTWRVARACAGARAAAVRDDARTLAYVARHDVGGQSDDLTKFLLDRGDQNGSPLRDAATLIHASRTTGLVSSIGFRQHLGQGFSDFLAVADRDGVEIPD